MRAVLTPTGARPEAISFCQVYLARQKLIAPVVWIVVDDGPKKAKIDLKNTKIDVVHLRPTPCWRPGENTQGRNLMHGLEYAIKHGGDELMLTVWEDDDWYDAEWLETVFSHLAHYEMVGEVKCRYYNVRSRRFKQLQNYRHAALRTTGMRGAGIDAFRECLKIPDRFYDLKLWKSPVLKCLYDWGMTTGIKGLPGRAGLAPGHDEAHGSIDRGMHQLRKWIGQDAHVYSRFYKEIKSMVKNKKMVALCDFKYGERGFISKGEEFELRNNDEERRFIDLGRAKPVEETENAPAVRRFTAKKGTTKRATKKVGTTKDEKLKIEKSEPSLAEKFMKDEIDIVSTRGEVTLK